jgi:hypothetical protein
MESALKMRNCLNCGTPLTQKQLRHGRRAKFCSPGCNMKYWIKTHPEHQSKAGKRGGAATVGKYKGTNMRKAYSVLTPELRRENKKFHASAVNNKAESLRKEGFLIIFQDGRSHSRPDIIAYKDGIIRMLDIKTKKRFVRVLRKNPLLSRVKLVPFLALAK